jgi:uncharacterized protein (DUF488 family)
VSQCHRKVLADWLAKAWGAEVIHLAPRAKHDTSGQPKLF